MLFFVPSNFFWIDVPFSKSKGRWLAIFDFSSPLLPYHSFHFFPLDVLINFPFFDSVFVLFGPKKNYFSLTGE
jgi:hypothetical protein